MVSKTLGVLQWKSATLLAILALSACAKEKNNKDSMPLPKEKEPSNEVSAGITSPLASNCTAEKVLGVVTIRCGDDVVVLKDGKDGLTCQVSNQTKEAYTIQCGDQQPITISNGKDGENGEPCDVTSDLAAGTATISCRGEKAEIPILIPATVETLVRLDDPNLAEAEKLPLVKALPTIPGHENPLTQSLILGTVRRLLVAEVSKEIKLEMLRTIPSIPFDVSSLSNTFADLLTYTEDPTMRVALLTAATEKKLESNALAGVARRLLGENDENIIIQATLWLGVMEKLGSTAEQDIPVTVEALITTARSVSKGIPYLITFMDQHALHQQVLATLSRSHNLNKRSSLALLLLLRKENVLFRKYMVPWLTSGPTLFLQLCQEKGLDDQIDQTVNHILEDLDTQDCDRANQMMSNIFDKVAVDVANDGVSDLLPLMNLRGIEALNLSNNAIADLTPLAGLTALHSLELAGNPIKDLSPLRLLRLRSLIVDRTPIAEEGFGRNANNCPVDAGRILREFCGNS